MSDSVHVVLDDTAMAAAGQDNVLVSGLIHRSHAESGWFLYAAQPTADRPDGAIIATTAPDRWVGEAVRVLDLTP